LLPNIIAGSGIGSLIAALVCIHSEEDLPRIFEPGNIDLEAFAKKSEQGASQRKILRLLKKGYLLDVSVIVECVKKNGTDVGYLTLF
jgi:TAG lipase/lysophosphatidylethanolamine acyltransferase